MLMKARKPPKDPSERIAISSKVFNGTACIEWTGSLTHNGYGQFSKRIGKGAQTTIRVHRWLYERERGPIPPGLVIDHLCLNKACVNVNHLEAVTVAENNRRAGKGQQTHCQRGHEFTEANTGQEWSGKGRRWLTRFCKECRRQTQHQNYLDMKARQNQP